MCFDREKYGQGRDVFSENFSRGVSLIRYQVPVPHVCVVGVSFNSLQGNRTHRSHKKPPSQFCSLQLVFLFILFCYNKDIFLDTFRLILISSVLPLFIELLPSRENDGRRGETNIGKLKTTDPYPSSLPHLRTLLPSSNDKSSLFKWKRLEIKYSILFVSVVVISLRITVECVI